PIMWAPLILCLVGGLTSAETGWKAGSQYSYELRGRTLTGLSQAADQYSGVNIRAKLQIQAKSDDVLSLQVQNAEFAEIHSNLSSGWTSEIPDDRLHYTKLEMSNKPFEVILQNGVVDRMVVSKDTPVWERNMLKAIVSLLQVDTNGENLKSSK
ncbi:hypothetical protein OV760_27675, partial [Salmonella enterica subsp. enterica serovar 1,4,[5],12:i:-]|nr:hypothetical protein [Salmonella enterica subsp. enterica serovar 1,4,[5],12:i:-]